MKTMIEIYTGKHLMVKNENNDRNIHRYTSDG